MTSIWVDDDWTPRERWMIMSIHPSSVVQGGRGAIHCYLVQVGCFGAFMPWHTVMDGTYRLVVFDDARSAAEQASILDQREECIHSKTRHVPLPVPAEIER